MRTDTTEQKLEIMLNRLTAIEKSMATKKDLESFATKKDLESFATKKDLERFATKKDLEQFATKKDLKSFATKKDLKLMATKKDIHKLSQKIEKYFKVLDHDLSIDRRRIMRIEEKLQMRFDPLES
ncbi:hypothetical protein HY468_00115 [Candidatus Roizmanbacteria bacterium]|nr:hypothetical protein [Candidatus Roizmanbacteria bacterium]